MKSTADYQNDFQYENGVLQFIAQPEGYIYKDATGYRYVYQYKDHLGNNRLSFMRNAGTVAIVKETNYYPFGLTHRGYNNLTTSPGSAGAKKYQYNGKLERSGNPALAGELQDDYGLDWYDYGARFYDASLGRWFVVDPLQQFHSPYIFAGDNPINNIDPSSMYSYNWNTGEYENNDGNVVSWDEVQFNNFQEPQKKRKSSDRIESKKNVFDNNISYTWYAGGFLVTGENSEQEGVNYLYNQSQKLGVEMSAYIVITETGKTLYFINNSIGNKKDESQGCPIKDGFVKLGSKKYKVLAQVHTHTTLGRKAFEGPSQQDESTATILGIPVYSIGFTEVSRVNPRTGNLSYVYYRLNSERTKWIWQGNMLKIANTKDLLNGKFSIIINLKNQ